MATINGYHIFAVPCAIKDSTESIHFTELENDISDGYYSQILFGSENGLRDWNLTLPTLAGASLSKTVTGINGETLTYEQYIWDLYSETKVTGRPFAYQSTRNGQYYLVRFADERLSYQRMLTKLYSAGIQLKQVRVKGKTVFNINSQQNATDLSVFSFHNGYDVINDLNTPYANWVDGTGWSVNLTAGSSLQDFLDFGDVNDTGTQNSITTLQFNVSTNDGYIVSDTNTSFGCREAVFVMKMREATFSNNAGVFTATTSANGAVLIGDTGTTKFFNLGLPNFEYRKNGILYPQSNMQAPMNTWGIVHVRSTNSVPFFSSTELQIGKDRDLAGRSAEMDLACGCFFKAIQPHSFIRELVEHLAITFNVT